MIFADQILVRLADAEQRANLFSEQSIETMAGAAYRMEPGQLVAPWSTRFDTLDLAPSVESSLAAEMAVQWEPMAQRGNANLTAQNLPFNSVRMHPIAYWGGAIIGQGRLGGGRIAEVDGSFVSLAGVDEAIDEAAGAGSEPEGAAREAARIEEIAARLSSAAGKGDSISSQLVQQWIDEKAGGDVAALLNSNSMIEVPGGFRVKYVSDAPAQDLPMALGVDAVVFAFDGADTSISAALRATQRAQEQMVLDRQPSPGVGGIDRRVPVLGVWVVPNDWFADADWPGADPSERRARANDWLRARGIAVVSASGP